MWRIVWRVLLGILALLIVASVGWYLYGWSCRRDFEARVADLRAAGQPTRFRDLATPPIPDEENGAKLLEEAARILKEHGPEPVSLWQTTYTDEERLSMSAYLGSLGPYFELLAQIPKRSGWRPDIDWDEGVEVMPGPIPDLVEAGRLLSARVEFDIEQEGRTTRAAETAVLLLDLGSICYGPFALAHSVALFLKSEAVDVLRQSMRQPGFDASLFRRMVDPLLAKAIPERGPTVSMLVEERVFHIGYVNALDEGSDLAGLVDPPMLPFLRRPRLYKDAIACLEIGEEAIRRADTTPEEAVVVAADFCRRFHASPRDDVVNQVGLAYGLFFAKHTERVAGLRLARVVMALLEHRQREGEWPESLAALGDLPTDPYSGKAFLYERIDRDCTVRSAKEGTPEDLEDKNLLWTLADTLPR